MFPRSDRGARADLPVLMKRAILAAAIVISCALPASAEEAAPVVPAASTKPAEPIIVNGDKVEYFQEKKEVTGTGNVSIVYKDVILTCDQITVNIETRDAEAVGNVRIRQNDAYFTGDKIAYNFDTRKGEVVKGYINAKPFYGKADSLTKDANQDVYTMNKGYVTTCDLDDPHYRIQAKQVKVYVNDKVVAKHVLVYAGKVPVFWIPYWVQPLGKERKTHITVIPGRNKDWGYYALTAYRYNINDRSKGDILLDYRSKKGLAVGVNHYINTREAGKGAFKFYYTRENNGLEFDNTGSPMTRYRFQYRHRWDLKDLDTSVIAEVNKLSDANIIKDYFYNEYQELGDRPDNYISVITAKRDFTTELLVRFAPNPFYQVVERLPEYQINILNYRIGKTNFYFSDNTSVGLLNLTNGKAYPKQKDVSVLRANTYNKISYSASLFKALHVTPYVAMGNTYYSRNIWGDTNLVRTYFDEGIDASIKFYHVYDVTSNFMGLDINKLRHIITPTAGYYHRHQPNIAPENLTQFDEIDAIDTQNGVLLGLENRLQTKRKDSDGQMKSVDLATLLVTTDYQFRLEKDELGLKSNKFNNIYFKFECIPYSWLYFMSDMTVNTKVPNVQTGNFDFVANGGDKWSLASGLRYKNDSTGISNQVTMDANYKLNEKWKVRLYERFDMETQKWEEQQFTIARDLHCWIAELTVSNGSARNTGIWLVMKLKAFPDYPIGLKQTYSKPRYGEAGAQ